MENFLFMKKSRGDDSQAACQCIYRDVSSPAVCKYQQTSIAVGFRSGRGGNESENIPLFFRSYSSFYSVWIEFRTYFCVTAVRNKEQKAQDNVVIVISYYGG